MNALVHQSLHETREWNGEAINIYVDSASGSDTNNGRSTASPLATLQAAIDQIPSVYSRDYVIHIASGTHTDGDVRVSGKVPIGDHGIQIHGYLNATAGQFTHAATVTGTATSASAPTDSGTNWTEAYLADTGATLTGVGPGYWLHITGGTGYDSDHDELNWYAIKGVSGSQVNILGAWSGTTPSTDTTYEILHGNTCRFTSASANPILTVERSNNVSVRFLHFNAASFPAVLLLNSKVTWPNAWRWVKLNSYIAPSTMDPYKNMWVGIFLNSAATSGSAIQVIDSDLTVNCMAGQSTAGAPLSAAYGASVNLIGLYASGYTYGLYTGLYARMTVSGAYLWQNIDNGWYVEGGWCDENEYVRVDGAGADGVNVSNFGRIWLRRYCSSQSCTGNGAKVTGNGSLAGNAATIHYNANGDYGVYADLNGVASVTGAGFSGNTTGSTGTATGGQIG